MVDTKRVQVFLDVVQTLSFTETARRMHVSQPTVSKYIHDLETELGLQLFDRGNGRPRLTEAGRGILPWARKLLQQSYLLEDMARSLQQDVAGSLTIFCTTAAGKYILPRLAARFRRRYPYVQVSILRCTQEDVAMHLLDHDAHLGVVSREITIPGIETQVFFDDVITLIVPSDHPWAARTFIEPAELVHEPLMLREPTSGSRRVVLEELAKHDIGLEDLNVFLEIGSSEGIASAVAAGHGVAFVSTLVAECLLGRGDVANVEVSGFNLRRKIYMVRTSLDTPHRAQEVFWSFANDPANADLLQLPARLEAVHKVRTYRS